MARRARVLETTSTDYFDDVTAIWMPPNSPPVDPRYHCASSELQKWAGPNWVNNDESYFFPIRHMLIKICERWHAHDWSADVRWIGERREDANHLSDLDRTFSKFSTALRKAPFKHAKRRLGLAFLAELCPEADVRLTSGEGIAAVMRAIDRFQSDLKIKDQARAQYGPIEYPKLPPQLPQREIAIALSLAVCISVWRRDGLAQGDHINWHKPVLSKNLPWKAIALFAWANSANAEAHIELHDVQKRVASLAKKVIAVDLYESGAKSGKG